MCAHKTNKNTSQTAFLLIIVKPFDTYQAVRLIQVKPRADKGFPARFRRNCRRTEEPFGHSGNRTPAATPAYGGRRTTLTAVAIRAHGARHHVKNRQESHRSGPEDSEAQARKGYNTGQGTSQSKAQDGGALHGTELPV